MTQPNVIPPPIQSSQFRYEAQSPTGEIFRGTLEAATVADATARLNTINLRVLDVSPASTSTPRRTPLGPDDFLIFNQQLAHLTAAGLPVERGLRLIAADMHSGRLSSAANAVAAELENGTPMNVAFAHHAARFPALYGRLIEAGVQAANLPAMLFNLGRHLELMSRLRRALWRTFAYPVAVLVALSLVMLFVSIVVVPGFRDIYRDFYITLPALTQFLLDWAKIYPTLLAGAALFVLICLIAAFLFRITGNAGLLADHIGLRIPIVGRVLRANLIARWCDSLRLGVEAGLDLPRAISLASDATGSKRLAQEGQRMIDLLNAGQPLADFQGDLLPATVPAACELGSRAGDLPATLATLTSMYEQQAEQRLRILPSLLTPVAMIFIATLIGICIAAMFLPFVRLIQSISS